MIDKKQPQVTDQEIAQVLIDWRSNMLNQLYRACLYFGIIGLVIMFLTDALPNPSQRPALLFYAALYLVFVFITIRKDLDYRVRGWFFLWVFYVLALLGLVRGGLAGDGRIFLVSIPVLATIFIGYKEAVITAGISTITLLVFSWFSRLEMFERLILDGLRINNPSLSIWLTESLYSLIIMGTLLVVLRQFHNFLLERIIFERRANYEVNQARNLLEQYNQSLEEQVNLRTSELAVAVKEAQEARAAAESASGVKSNFLATMSHEIRTPLNSILGMTSLLLDTPLTQKQYHYTETIRSSSDQLLSLINDILDFSKIEAERMDLEQTPFLLRQCLQSVMDLVTPRAREKGIELRLQIETGTPRAIIGDETRLRQVLVNLIGNAIKFTETGYVEVQARAEALEPQPELLAASHNSKIYRLWFTIRDTGIGISPEKLERLFQPFSQGDATTTRRYGGTGLGLVISKRLVEMMNGRIWVESQENSGSTFCFTIDVSAATALTTTPQPESALIMQDKTILVIEGDVTNRRIITLQLQAWNMHPRVTGSLTEALQWISQGKSFDAAIIDQETIAGDEASLLKRLSTFRSRSNMPIILLSSHDHPRDPEIDALLADQLVKPLKASTLYNALINIFGRAIEELLQTTQIIPEFDQEMASRHPLRILIVEDNDINQHLMILLLERMGYRADVAGDGVEALLAIQRQTYDVVLMDVQMPEMDGLTATRRIRHDFPPEQQPRIIAMTANAMRGDRELCLSAGMDDYISKPIRISNLIGCLNRCQSREAREQNVARIRLNETPGEDGSISLDDGVQILDMAELEKLLENLGPKSGDVLPPLVTSFFKQAERLIEAAAKAAAAGRLEELRRVAHTLKSNAATFGARRLETVARKLEEDARTGVTTHAENLIRLAETEYQRARTVLQEAQAVLPKQAPGHQQNESAEPA